MGESASPKQLVQRLERALQEKELQCEALFQAKQSMEMSIRQILTGENEADVFLQLQNRLQEERQVSKRCMEEKEQLSQKYSQMEKELRDKVDNLESQLAHWKKEEEEREAFPSSFQQGSVSKEEEEADLTEYKEKVEMLEKQLSQVKSKAKEFIHSKLADIRAENASLKEIIAAKEEEINQLKQSSVFALSSLDTSEKGPTLQVIVEDCKRLVSTLETETEEYDSYFQGLSELCSNLCSLLDVSDRDLSESSEAVVSTQVEKLKRLLVSIKSNSFENIHDKLIELQQLLMQLGSSIPWKPKWEEMQVQTEGTQRNRTSEDVVTKEDMERQDILEQLRIELATEREREEELKKALEKLTTIDSKRRDKLANLEKEKDELELALQKLTEEYNLLKEANSYSLERREGTLRDWIAKSSGLSFDDNRSATDENPPALTKQTVSVSQVTVDRNEEEQRAFGRLLDEIEEIVKSYHSHIHSSSIILESLEGQFLNRVEESEPSSSILELRNEVRNLQQELANTKEDKEKLEKSISRKEQQLRENFRNAMQNFAKEKQDLQKQHEEDCNLYQIRIKELEEERNSLSKTVSQLKSELDRQEETLAERQSAIRNLESLLETEHQKAKDWREQISRIKEEFLKYKEKARTALGQRDKTIRDVDSLLKRNNEEYRLQLDNLKSQIARLEERVSFVVQEKESLLEQERIEAREKEKQLEEELLRVKEEKSKRLEETFASLTEKESKILSLESKLDESYMEIRRLEVCLEQQSNRMKDEKQQLEKKVEELSWQNSDLQSKLQSLQKELSRWKETKSFSNLTALSSSGDQLSTDNMTRNTDSQQLQDAENDLKLYKEQLEFLKKEWRELNNKYQAAQKLKEDITFEYLRNVLLRFLQTDDLDTLLPVISRILQFSDEQMEEIREKRKQLLTGIRNAFKK